MVLYIFLGVVVIITFVVLGILFNTLSKEGQQKEDEKVVPLTDFSQLKDEVSLNLPVEHKPDLKATEDEIIPVPPAVELDTYKKRVLELEGEIRTTKQKTEEQSDVARQMILDLTKDNQSLKNQLNDLQEAQTKLSELQTQLETSNAKVQQPPPSEPDEALRQELETLKYELVKAKAQSSGLERISLNYKNQQEDFLKRVNAVQVTNDQLSEAKNRLEEMITQVKSENEELVKKDQLSLFELEKNRSRLLTLERECEDLKARVQQQSSGEALPAVQQDGPNVQGESK